LCNKRGEGGREGGRETRRASSLKPQLGDEGLGC